MQVTNEQLDKAAQAARKVAADDLGLTTKWDDLSMQAMDFYRKQALAVVATLPDAPEPIEGERRAAADAAERWHRAQKAKEGERWRVSDLHGHCALGPQDQVVLFHMTGGAKRDPEACAAFIARENARLDAEEGRNG